MRIALGMGLVIGLCVSSMATPLDTVFDAFHCIEYRDGDGLLSLLSDNFRQQLEFFHTSFLEIAEADPNTASRYLRGSGISMLDLKWMDLGEIASQMLEHISLPNEGDVIADSTEFAGDYAETILTMADSSKIYVYLILEEGIWKINSSSIITEIFGL